jgi:hypothetical protein
MSGDLGRVRRIGRVVEAAADRDERAATFTVESGAEVHRVRVVGLEAARRARALAPGTRVMVDGRFVGTRAVLLAQSVHPVR